MTRIAAVLGVDVGAVRKVVARLACAGGDNVARRRADYQGRSTCLAAAQVAGGGKDCYWGCLGFGDCATACDFDAIRMDQHALPVVDEERCTACGDCVDVCPKDLFSLQDADNRLWVRCKNGEFGDGILAACEVACTACARCAADAPEVVTMADNLPLVDYAALHNAAGHEARVGQPSSAARQARSSGWTRNKVISRDPRVRGLFARRRGKRQRLEMNIAERIKGMAKQARPIQIPGYPGRPGRQQRGDLAASASPATAPAPIPSRHPRRWASTGRRPPPGPPEYLRQAADLHRTGG